MSKRKLKDLIDTQEPAIELLQHLVNDAEVPCELLPPGPDREKALVYLQAQTVTGDQCFAFFPFLWTKEGSIEKSHRSTVPMSQMWDAKVDIVRQMMG